MNSRPSSSPPSGTPSRALPLSGARRILKKFHPEGLRGGFARFYTGLSARRPFDRFYDLLARDIAARVPQGRVLDVGTGPGRLLIKLQALAPQLRLTGLDVSPDMLARARKVLAAAGLEHAIPLVAANASRLPFPDGSFDAVISTGSLHHWKDPVAGLAEIHRVLVAGGQALIYDLVQDTPREELRNSVPEVGRFHVLFMWAHGFLEPFYKQDELRRLAAASPFPAADLGFVRLVCRLALRKIVPPR